MISGIWHYLSGYVIIKLKGHHVKETLNMLLSSGIRMWRVKWVSGVCVSCCMSNTGYKRMMKLDLRGVRIELEALKGLPGRLQDIKRPKLLVFGLAAAFIAIFAMTSFIWRIEFTGDTKKRDALLAQLEGMGVKPGVFSWDVDTDALETRLKIDDPEIAWIDIRVRGVELNVEYRLKEMPPDVVSDTPGNIVAAKDAVISSITATRGQAVKSRGQAVKAGDILISGYVQKDGIMSHSVNASGEVQGRVFYSSSVESPVFEDERIPPGEEYLQRTLEMGSWVIPLETGGGSFEDYDVRERITYIGDLYFPVKVVSKTFTEVNVVRKELDLDKLIAETEQQAYDGAVSMLPDDAIIDDVKISHEIVGDVMRVNVLIEAIEDIGIWVEN